MLDDKSGESDALRGGTLSTREAAAVESAIEDEQIALRVGLLWMLTSNPCLFTPDRESRANR